MPIIAGALAEATVREHWLQRAPTVRRRSSAYRSAGCTARSAVPAQRSARGVPQAQEYPAAEFELNIPDRRVGRNRLRVLGQFNEHRTRLAWINCRACRGFLPHPPLPPLQRAKRHAVTRTELMARLATDRTLAHQRVPLRRAAPWSVVEGW